MSVRDLIPWSRGSSQLPNSCRVAKTDDVVDGTPCARQTIRPRWPEVRGAGQHQPAPGD